MKKIIKTIKIYALFLTTSILINACCETDYQIVGNGKITSISWGFGITQ